MAPLRTIEEAERVINANGRPPHDEHIMLKDGRVLRTREEVLEWIHAMAAEADSDR